MRRRLEAWMAAQGDTKRLFNTPIPLGPNGLPVAR
jgi:hypothetical protein